MIIDPAAPLTLTDASFDEAVAIADRPLVVDFWADWCGPCRAVAPLLEELAAEHADEFTLAKVDVDANPALATRFGVQSIPTLLVLTADRVLGRFVGAKPKADLLREIRTALAG